MFAWETLNPAGLGESNSCSSGGKHVAMLCVRSWCRAAWTGKPIGMGCPQLGRVRAGAVCCLCPGLSKLAARACAAAVGAPLFTCGCAAASKGNTTLVRCCLVRCPQFPHIGGDGGCCGVVVVPSSALLPTGSGGAASWACWQICNGTSWLRCCSAQKLGISPGSAQVACANPCISVGCAR